jgi:hypothetical protein
MKTYRGVASMVFNHYTLKTECNIREWNSRRKRMYFADPLLPFILLKDNYRPDVKFLYKRVDKSLKSACWQYAKTRKGMYS